MENSENHEILPSPAPAETSEHVQSKPASTSKKVSLIIVFTLIGFAVSFSGGLLGGMLASSTTSSKDIANYSIPKNDGNKVVSSSEQDISSLVDKVSPGVVSIIISTGSGGVAGTGMIISKDGYVMTNKHVVSNASQATIALTDGKVYKNVRVIGSDPLNDIAFLKIDGVNDLPALTIGDSKTVHVGQQVVAIGNALGEYQNSVTTGIISGLGRPIIASSDGEYSSDAESLTDLLQTDAAINQGNSGGPLLNTSGQVIGMNTAVATDTQSIGFAIPIGAAKGEIDQLLKTGKIEHAFIGVQYVPITPETKAEYNLPLNNGNYIVSDSGDSIQSGSPADKAGIKNGDIILKVNGEDIGPGKSVSTLVGEFKPGDTIQVTVYRGGKNITLQVTLGTYK